MPDPIHAVDPTQPPEAPSAGQAPATAAAGGSSRPPAPGAVDSADVGRAETLLATIATAAADVPVVDRSRVAELQRAILSGSYRIDPQQIARKIVEIEQLLAPQGP